jgi:hypothetical protein
VNSPTDLSQGPGAISGDVPEILLDVDVGEGVDVPNSWSRVPLGPRSRRHR